MKLWEFFISHLDEVADQTSQHILLTFISIALASIIGIIIGVVITRAQKLSNLVLGFIGVIQTIPSLALLGFLLPILGIGVVPSVVALFLYALLPIVRNTFTGISEIDPSIKEATVGMGMTNWQLLRYVELPLAFPIILAGIRTSAVINIGIATLCALIGAGGLGEFIFRGISLNNTYMILAGAIPASLLALLVDSSLGFLQKTSFKGRIIFLSIVVIGFISFSSISYLNNVDAKGFKLTAGFNSEFIEREDGYIGLNSTYNLPVAIKELEVGLMYKALYEGDVDLIDGFSTDGRIKKYNLKSLIDDKNYFPPYYAIPIINGKTLAKYPELNDVFNVLENKMNDDLMSELNYQVDGLQRPLEEVAFQYLNSIGINADKKAGNSSDPDLIIGSKAFSENFLLAYIFAQLIEAKTNLSTKLQLGFGGTKLVFDALRYDEIDIYPEYTGTAFLVLLKAETDEKTYTPESTYQYVKTHLKSEHNIAVMPPLGFNNTFAIMLKADMVDSLGLKTISDLSNFLFNGN